jgi:hypothetical protein
MAAKKTKTSPDVGVTVTVDGVAAEEKTFAVPEAVAEPPTRKDWRDPDVTFSPDDNSLEAQMWRLGNRQATTGTR